MYAWTLFLQLIFLSVCFYTTFPTFLWSLEKLSYKDHVSETRCNFNGMHLSCSTHHKKHSFHKFVFFIKALPIILSALSVLQSRSSTLMSMSPFSPKWNPTLDDGFGVFRVVSLLSKKFGIPSSWRFSLLKNIGRSSSSSSSWFISEAVRVPKSKRSGSTSGGWYCQSSCPKKENKLSHLHLNVILLNVDLKCTKERGQKLFCLTTDNWDYYYT